MRFIPTTVAAMFARRKRFDSFVTKIERNVDELLAHAQYQIDNAVNTDAKAAALAKQAAVYREDADRATRVANRLISLLD